MLKQQLSFLIVFLFNCSLFSQTIPYAIVDTDVTDFYGNDELITAPSPGDGTIYPFIQIQQKISV